MQERAMLILRDGDDEPRRWPIEGQQTRIGRWDDNEVVLDDREVSRSHAQIRHEGGRYVIVDLGSKNGTLVNGTPIDGATPLRDGDEILIAPRYKLLFVDSDATAPARRPLRGIEVDPTSRTVTVAGEPVEPPLAPNQYALVELLAEQPNRVYTREEIAAACYPEAEGDVSDHAIDGVVRRLRARLAEVDPEGDYIAAVRGHGFKLEG